MDPVSATARPRVDPFQILAEASDIAANHALDLDHLLRALEGLIRKVVSYQLFAILLADADGVLTIRHSIGYRADLAERLRVKPGEGITGTAVQTRTTVVANDVAKDPRYLRAIDAVRSEIAVPLIARGKLVGVIDLQSSVTDAFGEQERNLLELVGSRFTLAIDAAGLYEEMVRKNETLTTLTKIAREFSSILNLDELLNKIAELVRGIVPFDALAIFLIDQGILRHYFGVRFNARVAWQNMPIGYGLVGHAAADRQPILVRNTAKDPRYVALVEGIRSEVAVPLILKDSVIGVLDLESDKIAAFDEDVVQTLTLLAPQIAAAIENARLYEQVAANQERLQKDLRAARQLQQSLLPFCCPTFGGIEIAARNLPASEVSGDFYDFIARGEESIGIWSGDVSGKGAAAALYAAVSSGLLRTLAVDGPDPRQLLTDFNHSLLARQLDTRYLAGLYAEWRPAARTLTVASAGQPRPLFRHGGSVQTLDIGGIPLGLLEESNYDRIELQLGKGDLFVTASDGVHEARDAAGNDYGDARLRELIQSLPLDLSAERVVSAILEDVARFSGREMPSDDRTVIVLRAV